MRILHNKTTEGHNETSSGEGSYRVIKFTETVTNQEVENIFPIVQTYIGQVHSARYIRKIKGACKSKCRVAETLLQPGSYNAIITSASLAILAAQKEAFAITRPPGHHASQEKAAGFCFFNNMAIATSYLLDVGKKVCIIEIDGHHGNGTQSIFRKNSRVLFCSIHQDNVYPHAVKPCNSVYGLKEKQGSVLDAGQGPSLRKVINIPLSEGSGDDLLLKSLGFLQKYIERFNPDQIGVSAGFDGYSKDRILDLNYTLRGYYEAGKCIASFGKPLFAVLEGGYHEEVKECVESFVSGVSSVEGHSDGQMSISSAEKISECMKKFETLAKGLGD